MNTEGLIQKLRQFNQERDWSQFHNPKDLAAALAIEASELQQLFLWMNKDEVEKCCKEKRDAIEEEIADIALFLLVLADTLKIDLEAVILRKMEKNALKYPVQKAKGNCRKYIDL